VSVNTKTFVEPVRSIEEVKLIIAMRMFIFPKYNH